MYLTNKEGYRYYVVDVEANGLNPTKLWCAVIKELGVPGFTKLVGSQQITRWFKDHESEKKVIVGHNAISYDVPVLNRLAGDTLSSDYIVDTQVLSFLYWPKIPGKHSLAAYGERFGLPKVGGDIEQWDVYEPIMLDRCQRDVELTERLLLSLRQKMLAIGFSEMSCDIEHRVRQAVDWQQSIGFKFDVDKAEQFYMQMLAKEQDLAKPVLELFPPALKLVKTCKYKVKKDGTEGATLAGHRQQYPKIDIHGDTYGCYALIPFNLASPQQRLKRMQGLGYVAKNFTKKTKKGGGGNPIVDEDGLNDFLEDCDEAVKPAVKAMTEWLVVNSRAKMAKTWLDSVDPETGAIHGMVWTCGAGSRRCTHNDPNTANIPGGEAPYGMECRSFWKARENRVLVGCDAKAIQMRMFAHYLDNLEVGMQYIAGDPHTRNAEAAEITRKKVKNCFYAMIFGAQDKKLGTTAHGGTGNATQGGKIRKALYTTTPGLEALFATAEAAFNEGNGWMQCIDGGWVRCPSPHAALNYWIQSAEAILMKMVVVAVWRKIIKEGWDAWQVGFIHDEVQYDCHPDYAVRVADAFKDAILRAGKYLKFIVPMEGDSKEGPTWAQTH